MLVSRKTLVFPWLIEKFKQIFNSLWRCVFLRRCQAWKNQRLPLLHQPHVPGVLLPSHASPTFLWLVVGMRMSEKCVQVDVTGCASHGRYDTRIKVCFFVKHTGPLKTSRSLGQEKWPRWCFFFLNWLSIQACLWSLRSLVALWSRPKWKQRCQPSCSCTGVMVSRVLQRGKGLLHPGRVLQMLGSDKGSRGVMFLQGKGPFSYFK